MEEHEERSPRRRVLVWIGLVVVVGVGALFVVPRSGAVDDRLAVLGTMAVQLLLLLVPLALACAALFMLLYTGSLKRRIRVFLSHNNADVEDARELAEGLAALGIETDLFPVEDVSGAEDAAQRRHRHNRVIQEVRAGLRRCDALIAIPPASSRSFAAAEILAASALGRAILLIAPRTGRPLPATAFGGYPVLSLPSLRREGFAPAAELLGYVTNHRSQVVRSFHRAAEPFAKVMVVSLVLLFVFAELSGLASAFGKEWTVTLLRGFFAVLFGACMLALLVGVVRALLRRRRLRHQIRQTVVEGGFEPRSLEEAFGPARARPIRGCLVSLSPEHTGPSRQDSEWLLRGGGEEPG